ncbi:MAG TPA: alpha/beta hydrolase, partial [Myxococcota bacterium]|nr:alpha/beta hydrolase [Myxococcota bacterium]
MLMSLIDSLALTTLRAQGFSSRFYATSGGEVHLMEADGQGSGPPILMLHGLGSCSADYFFLMPALRKKARRIITLDFPGHGASGLPSAGMSPPVLERALLEVADQLLSEPMVVFGNSLGG